MTGDDRRQQETTGDDGASGCYTKLSNTQYYLCGCLYCMHVGVFPVKWRNQHEAVGYIAGEYCRPIDSEYCRQRICYIRFYLKNSISSHLRNNICSIAWTARGAETKLLPLVIWLCSMGFVGNLDSNRGSRRRRDGRRWHTHIQEAEQRGSLSEWVGNERWTAIGKLASRRQIGDALTKNGNWVVGPDWGPTPPDLSSRSLFQWRRERERERESPRYMQFFFWKYHPSQAVQRQSFAMGCKTRHFLCTLCVIAASIDVLTYN